MYKCVPVHYECETLAAGIGAGGAPQASGSHGLVHVMCGDRTETFTYTGSDQTFTM